ncbi:MAG: hypothetical protein HY247_03025 [archaeon]|nr:MAG: hypothetical protein HY247_03025 [archaeon]
MKIKLRRGQRVRGVAGIIAAVILFALIFTVGLGFYLSVNTNNALLQGAQQARFLNQQAALSENLVLATQIDPITNDLQFMATNRGGVATTIVAAFVTDASNVVTSETASSSPPFPPVTTSVLGNSSFIDTGVPCIITIASSPNCLLKVVTSRGNVFVQTYPPTPVQAALNALSSGAIGDLFLNQNSFIFYTVQTPAQNPTCPAANVATDTSGFCLSAAFSSAFTINSALYANTGPTYSGLAFSITVKNLNSLHKNLVLDENTVLEMFTPHGASGFGLLYWYLVSTSGSVILDHYTPIVLQYNKPVTLTFASSGGANPYPVCQQGGSGCRTVSQVGIGQITTGSSSITPPADLLVFILSHGCEGTNQASCAATSANYGQNLPYVTIFLY